MRMSTACCSDKEIKDTSKHLTHPTHKILVTKGHIVLKKHVYMYNALAWEYIRPITVLKVIMYAGSQSLVVKRSTSSMRPVTILV